MTEHLVGSLLTLYRLEHLEATHQSLNKRHHGSCIVELTTIVRRAEKGAQLPLCEEHVTILHHLVHTAD